MNLLGLNKTRICILHFSVAIWLNHFAIYINHSKRGGYWSTRTFTFRSLESLALVW